jgi:hypothetical protein
MKRWLAIHPTLGRRAFEARTWFDARALACAFFGCEPGQLTSVELQVVNGAGA